MDVRLLLNASLVALREGGVRFSGLEPTNGVGAKKAEPVKEALIPCRMMKNPGSSKARRNTQTFVSVLVCCPPSLIAKYSASAVPKTYVKLRTPLNILLEFEVSLFVIEIKRASVLMFCYC